MNIIKANNSYLPQIMQLYEGLFEEMAQIDPMRFKAAEQNEDFILNILSAEDADVLLAEKDNEIVGLALVLEDETPDYNCLLKRKTAVLMDFTVEKKCRGIGIGKTLLQASKDWAKHHNAEYLQLNVVAGNDKAINLYRLEGFENTMITMEYKL